MHPMRPPPPLDRTPPPAALAFRRMDVGDLERVMAIAREGFANPWSPELLKRELAHDWSTVLVAIRPAGAAGSRGERIVGFIVYWLVHDEVHVLNIATALDERRRGVARALMGEAVARGRRAGAALATLEVRRSNEPALALYRSLGYRQAGVRPNYYVDEGEDAIVMVTELHGDG